MQDIYKPLRSKSYSVPCELCSIGSMCIPMLLNNTLNTALNRKQEFAKNQVIVNEGAAFDKFYIIHSGALKTYVTTDDGIEQINGFYLPGDIVGLDSIANNKYNNSIKTLTSTLLCELEYGEVKKLISQNIQIRDIILDLMSKDILNYQKLILSYSQKNADQKLASFIYALYSRYSQRGHTSLNIKLSMSRADIANYLGLTIETVSRVLTRMQDADTLSVKGKYICIKDISALINLAREKV